MGYEPTFRITAETLRLVAEATEVRAWIATAVIDVPWLPSLQRDTTARLAHSSTSIEGNPLTLPEVEALARGETVGGERKATLKIQQARDLDDDLTDWVEYMAQGVVSTLNQTAERIRSLQIRGVTSKIILTKRQEDLLRFLRDRGIVSSSDLQSVFKFTRARAAQILKPLVAAGLVEVVGRQRSTRYRLEK